LAAIGSVAEGIAAAALRLPSADTVPDNLETWIGSALEVLSRDNNLLAVALVAKLESDTARNVKSMESAIRSKRATYEVGMRDTLSSAGIFLRRREQADAATTFKRMRL
jgi:hypothetical protein